MSETVKLEVVLAWSYTTDKYSDQYDTDITLTDRNEMSERARSDVMQEAYEDVVTNQNMGGVSVVTPGAKG